MFAASPRVFVRPIFAKQLLLLVLGLIGASPAAERINQEGRILGDPRVVTSPTLFNTPEADAIVASMQIFPRDNPWNEDISKRPTLANSDAMIAQVMADLNSSRRTLRLFSEMNFVLVPDNQPLIPVNFFKYADQSDPSPYPIPSNLPIESWPVETGNLTLSEWQQDINNQGGDRHSITVMPGAGFLWETWSTKLVNNSWQAANGAKFNLNSNALRPNGWTSGDAAGLPMFPALVRFDECQRGMVEHAMRLVVKRTRLGPIYPATHEASVGSLTDPNIPAMGQRFRLKSGFNISGNWTTQEKAVLLGLKKYGAIVADNGNFFSISITPDNRYPADCFAHMSSISITNFEVIQATGPAQGPRSPGAPQADAGPDQSLAPGASFQLEGSVLLPNTTASLKTLWKLYSGPAPVTFADSSRTNTTATFATPGTYIVILSADDSIHTVSYDAVNVVVSDIFTLAATRSGSSILLSWSARTPPYTVQTTENLVSPDWRNLTNTPARNFQIPDSLAQAFFRLRSSP
jgi:hypothetical protein